MTSKKVALNGQGLTHSENNQDNIFDIDATDISFIKFEGVQVRIFKVNNEPWFIAKDICDALELSNHRMALKALDDDEKGVSSIYTLGGKQKMKAISESGFYKLIARSRKATKKDTLAYRFTNWVFRNVIPSIRKTGSYGVPFAALNDFTRRQNEYKAIASQRGRDLQSCKGELASLNQEGRELWSTYQPDLLEEAE
ncbi:antirepressor protein [Xenorhabdus sp. XENO-1]|uniref:BRO-N domain-containing protein n=1 Tax=Xenorhabdus bovienii TaxID=40576 RepID=UPI0020CA2EBA|nr:BRO family protein [Xenorhabdus bovienii]MCP9270079.1 antirepressor protein [Xenorhabdus bovienii subsp. africana]